MRYCIEYTGGYHNTFVNNRQELVKQIQLADPGTVEDIRKLYKSGVSDSVMEKYEKYIKK